MRLIIVRHGETDWTLAGRYTGATEVLLTANGRREAAQLRPLLDHALHDQSPVVVSSPRQRATDQIHRRPPGWDVWRDGCPRGESTADVGARADTFLRTTAEDCPEPLIVFTHGHFSRIVAARALGLAAECGQLFASTTASVSLIEDHHGERCLGLWNADAALLEHPTDQMSRPYGDGQEASRLLPAGDRAS